MSGYMKHTPGPWLIRVDGTNTARGPEVFAAGSHYDDGSQFVVADCGATETSRSEHHWRRTEDADMIDANARLIAAAPEMLEALEECIVLLNARPRAGGGVCRGCDEPYSCPPSCPIKKARAAVAKVRR